MELECPRCDFEFTTNEYNGKCPNCENEYLHIYFSKNQRLLVVGLNGDGEITTFNRGYNACK